MTWLSRLGELVKRGVGAPGFVSDNISPFRPSAVSAPNFTQRTTAITTPILGDYLAYVLLWLWLVELLLCALLLYHLLTATTGSGLRLQSAERAILTALIASLLSFAIGVYSREFHLEVGRLLAKSVAAIPMICLVAWATGINVIGVYTASPQLTLHLFAGWAVLVACLRLSCSYAVRSKLYTRRVIIAAGDEGSNAAATRLLAALELSQDGLYEVTSVMPARQAARLTPELLGKYRIWGVVICPEAQALVLDEMPAWQRSRLWTETAFWEGQLRRVDIDQPVEAWQRGIVDEPDRLKEWIKRGSDILLSMILIVVTGPIMLLIALLIKIDSPGRVLYRQKRVGLNGRVFNLLKFRSMRVDAEAAGPVWASQLDPRITRIGRALRLAHMDELPQLLNVLRGEMSLVGPRPERPHFVAQLAEQMPLYNERARLRPGLTGWAQVNYPYGASVEDARAKLSYDLYYVKYRGLIMDALILISTVRVVLSQKGAR